MLKELKPSEVLEALKAEPKDDIDLKIGEGPQELTVKDLEELHRESQEELHKEPQDQDS